MKFIDKIKEFIKNKNFKRAALVYVTSFVIGGVGFVRLGPVGVFMLACVPAVGSGLATSFLSTEDKKPVTRKSRGKSALMILGQFAVTVAVYNLVLGSPLILAIPANIAGTVIGLVSGQVGLSIITMENARLAKQQTNGEVSDPQKLSQLKVITKGLTTKLGQLKIKVQQVFNDKDKEGDR